LTPQSLKSSWQATEQYINQAFKLTQTDASNLLDHEEAEMILAELGVPPRYCYPLYIFTVGSGASEIAVYVGKTSTTHGRFNKGHQVCTRLHEPQYHGLDKRLYLGHIVHLNRERDYLPIEWIYPDSLAEEILNSFEAKLIFELQPELNDLLKKSDKSTFNTLIHIQNFTNETHFLDNYFIFEQ
jgi:hypothetical protein